MHEHTHQNAPNGEAYRKVTDDVLRPMQSYSLGWMAGVAFCAFLILVGAISEGYQLKYGMGMSGLMHPMMWAVYITNFVWWIGIAHSGTLISAFLFLFRAPFRAAFSRASEAMTLFAVMTAGLFPLIHLGRPWRAYWLMPYPNERMLWINFRSALVLDVFAVTTYFIVSTLFFWLGLIPDVAVVRDRSKGWKRTIYGLLSVGWEGRGKQWRHYWMAYSVLACLAAPLVVSVHSVVSWDFASAIVPGWHSTISAPYFVAGAILSGLAMVLTLLIPLRKNLALQEYITIDRMEQIAKLTLLMSMVVGYSYLSEHFMTLYGREPSDLADLWNKVRGTWASPFWAMNFCNVIAPLILFWRPARRNIPTLFVVSIIINIGMWLERFNIIAGSLARDYNPYAWAPTFYHFRPVEVGITLGSLGWFMFFFLLFTKFLPVLPIAELKRDILLEHREDIAIEEAHEHPRVPGGVKPAEATES
ncbi:MAG TPA: NrfD/PsrC family molybdoenzyme membrane anchor subunit [Armatimonadota bacterium]|jgi:molybdopterin-containing oxidoreductase family membrane subunit